MAGEVDFTSKKGWMRSQGLAKESGFAEELEAAKRRSVLQLLFRCARLLNARALDEYRARTGQEGLREVHLRLYPHIDLEGTRLTELAKRLGVSKQAAGQWVDELVAMGALEKVPDPADGRARLICFSEAGRRAMLGGLGLLIELEDGLVAQVGAEKVELLRGILAELLDGLEG